MNKHKNKTTRKGRFPAPKLRKHIDTLFWIKNQKTIKGKEEHLQIVLV
jgi:cell division GTPase FtsZ